MRVLQNYTLKEVLLRVLWGFGKVLFRLTPRPCFALRASMLRLFGAKVGRRVNIYPTTTIYYPWNFEIGDDSAIGEWALVYNLGNIRIGDRTTVSQRVHLCAGTHDYREIPMPLLKPSIRVGDEVWVCADAFIGPNVTLADRAIVAAASVVVKDVSGGQIVGGNPAKYIKERSE
tara:strand:+ start:13167 stop:13688 length:522 start_codon:yes stop_codon:yes gene_type:complete